MRAPALIAALLVCAACGKQPVDRKEEPPPVAVPITPPPLPPPVMPPEEPPATVATLASASASAPKPPNGTEFDRASQAALNGNYGAVRSLLQPKVRAGRGTPDERRLLRSACKILHDQACIDETAK